MDKLLEELIQKYKTHLAWGEKLIIEMQIMRRTQTSEYKNQTIFNKIWKMIIKDFELIADKNRDENK